MASPAEREGSRVEEEGSHILAEDEGIHSQEGSYVTDQHVLQGQGSLQVEPGLQGEGQGNQDEVIESSSLQRDSQEEERRQQDSQEQ